MLGDDWYSIKLDQSYYEIVNMNLSINQWLKENTSYRYFRSNYRLFFFVDEIDAMEFILRFK